MFDPMTGVDTKGQRFIRANPVKGCDLINYSQIDHVVVMERGIENKKWRLGFESGGRLPAG